MRRYVIVCAMEKKTGELFEEVVKIMERLRGPNGCPWDKEQTHASLKCYLVEEAYEVLEALDQEDPEKVQEELGDLLYQIIFHARIAWEEGAFDISDVLRSSIEKMTRRHPHVFDKAEARDPEEVLRQWYHIKATEENNRENKSILDAVPTHLPALHKAWKVQERVAKIGFDWQETEDVLTKLEEEVQELRKAVEENNHRLIEEELGDLFFSLVNLARFLKIDPEENLRQAVNKFINRFKCMEEELTRTGKSLYEFSLKEMDEVWKRNK